MLADADDGLTKIDTTFDGDTVWLSIDQMAEPVSYTHLDVYKRQTDMFMNTGISTYIWVLSKDKPAHRAGKVQLIDASHCFCLLYTSRHARRPG